MEATILGASEKLEEINKWLDLPYFIAELEYERKVFSNNYYQEHSLYTHIVYNGQGIATETPRVEMVAINLADSCLVMDRRIKRNKEGYRLFSEFLARLPTKEVEALKTQYISSNNQYAFTNLDRIIFNAIQDIKGIIETNDPETKTIYQKKLKKRMENL